MVIPVFPVTIGPVSGAPAIPVYVVDPNVSLEEVSGGSAQPVYYVSDAELASGRFRLEARSVGLPIYPVGLDERRIAAGPAMPVYLRTAPQTVVVVITSFMLLEDGASFLLLEDGGRIDLS